MNISFRGVNYEDNAPMLEVTEAEITGRNRHQNTGFPYVRHIPVPPSKLNLRNCACHRTNQTVVKPVATINESQLLSNEYQNTLDEVDRTHNANIYRSLERRLQIAKARGDRQLLRFLEAESQQLAFCCSISGVAS